MIQSGTYLNVVDNSGAKDICCIKVLPGYKRKYASVGDIIVVSVKSLRSKRRSTSKVKKGDVLKAASWNAPALNRARGNVFEGLYPMKWTGPLYLN